MRSDGLLQETGREKNVRRAIARGDANILQRHGKDERKFFKKTAYTNVISK